ncbi:hypothetical protein BJV78DRAFT_1381944 [Lactifluus subvellereus]|nr:hypothetical protein BJV78DRAFT_1381944 [Lactifluus subvellereus]
MARSALSALVAVASFTYVAGQASAVPTFPATPLANLDIPYTAIPYKVFPGQFARGTQFGYNQCNSSTENQQSLCQTGMVNSISDFCVFAPSKANSTISDTEGEEVCWCTKKGHGCRTMPAGTITGIQVLRNVNYWQIFAYIHQENINIQTGDFGGELDSGGQDLLGNPIGGLMYSKVFSADNATIVQVKNWNMFVGGNTMAIKICDAKGSNPTGYCQHTLDRIGYQYNMPNNAKAGVFEMCDSDAMDIPGVYTVNGQTLSYAQPPESLGPITTIPYTARIPASSNCVTYQSSALYTDLQSLPTATGASSAMATGSGTGTRAGTASVASSTTGSNGAGILTISLFSSILGVAFSIALLA